jgi:putative transposase
MGVLKAYRFRIYPDAEQKQFFIQTFGCVRFTYNHLLMHRKQNSESKLTPALLKKDYPFLKDTDSLALSNAQRNLEKAFRRYYSGQSGFPNLKNKSNMWQSYTTNNQKHTIYFEDDKLKLPKLKSLVDVNLHRKIKGEIKSATISARKTEEFYVSILCIEEVEKLEKTHRKIEISYCPKHLVHFSEEICPIHFNQEKLLGQINHAKRKLRLRAKIAKKRKVLLANAKNYQKQKEKMNRLLVRRKYKKEDFINQLSYFLVENFDYIFVQENNSEDKYLKQEFTSNDWQQFLSKLRYKSEWYGKQVIIS